MRSKRVHHLGLMLVLLAVGAACARITGGGSGAIEHPRGSEDLLVQVHSGGGFVPLVWHLREMPLVSLYGDGTVITHGPQVAIYPPPTLPPLVERRVSEEGIQAILRAAREAGLQGPDRRYEDIPVADAPTTRFTVVAEGGRHVTAAYGLGEFDESPEYVPSSDREARRKLVEFQTMLLDLEGWLPEGSVSPDRPYAYDRLSVFVVPLHEGGGFGDEELEPSNVDWPLEEPLSVFGEAMPNTPDVRCGTVQGPDLDAVLEAAGGANVETEWRSDGDVRLLAFRPLLPGEPSCPQL